MPFNKAPSALPQLTVSASHFIYAKDTFTNMSFSPLKWALFESRDTVWFFFT